MFPAFTPGCSSETVHACRRRTEAGESWSHGVPVTLTLVRCPRARPSPLPGVLFGAVLARGWCLSCHGAHLAAAPPPRTPRQLQELLTAAPWTPREAGFTVTRSFGRAALLQIPDSPKVGGARSGRL